ncbi:MAG TPA: ABC transporter ATP-binding protein [Mycobacteriales bacterium]|nr:ABC transporter ATP-binding protein [Mycobacteriales bacterium]
MSKHSPQSDAVIDLDSVTLTRGGVDLLSDVSWSVESDERWVVLGPNGAGKTTLLSILAGRLHPTRGTVHLLGERLGAVDVFELRPRLGLSSASLADRIPPNETVADVVITSAYAVVGRFSEAYDSVDEFRRTTLLSQFGIAHLADRRYGTLSEGERKRTQIARALMTDPEVLLLDEPAAGLDLGAREDLVRRLSTLAADPAAPALVLVTHHVEEIPPGITHALLLSRGRIVSAGKLGDVITGEQLSAAFGVPMMVRHDEGRIFARAM